MLLVGDHHACGDAKLGMLHMCCDTIIKLYVDLCKRIVISDIIISIHDTCDAQLLTLIWRSCWVMLVLVRPWDGLHVCSHINITTNNYVVYASR